MAKPDLSNGFLQLAHELFAAVMVAHLPKEARIVLCEVFSQVYGPAKAKACRLSPTEIAVRTGLAKPNVARGIACLLKNGVLRRDGADAYRFVKDYDSWGSDGTPLMPPILRAYAAFAPRLAQSNMAPNLVIETDNASTEVIGQETPAVVDGLSKNGCFVIETDNALPYRDKDKRVVVGEGDESVTRSLSEVESDNGSRPTIWSRRPFRPDPAELARVKDVVGAIDPHAYLGQKVQNTSTLYPLDWIEDAFALAAGQGDRIAHYANSTLIRWWRQGRKDEPEATEPKVPRPAAADPFGPEAPARAPRLTPAQERRRLQLAAFDEPAPADRKERS